VHMGEHVLKLMLLIRMVQTGGLHGCSEQKVTASLKDFARPA